ncbi:molybdopterin cofactor-binding domain-containing protein [Bradyrhizobium sp. AS23.2]|uniref:FAD binding domain-containing protein n=1 Tax=Bradyrhizobium sp. AS23.2 TaxID=1680155 RepID=UPI000966022B|nr:molybdopterin cofactor-binding domain-containing protein [Bradyrhizobium sp. AS23.2]OKO81217.1 hypothetical protein AC630_14650 [Bradyrhizobium sp. AS23.2]
MRASAFAYARATSIANVLELLAVHGEKARVLSGGQSLIPAMNPRLVAPEVIVDIGELTELRGIAVKGETLVIGALIRHAHLLKSSDIVKCAPRIELNKLARIVYFRPDTLPPGIQPEVMATKHFVPREYPFAFTNGVQAAWVEHNGFVKLLKHWVVEDRGTIINPQLVDEQIRGGVVQGLRAAHCEKCIDDDRGQLTNANMADYLVPVFREMPDTDVGHVVSPTRESKLGTKGAGAAGTAGAAAAVTNAVNDALKSFGTIITEIPLTPQVILTALGQI